MATSAPRRGFESVSPTVLDVWKKYEDVAMHFNDLMMRWRLQVIGGLAALVTLAGFVVGDAGTVGTRYRAMCLLSGTLAFVWIGVACIDLFYYRKLLKGAVESIIAVESETQALDLSTKIEERAQKGSSWAPWVFYVAGLVPLLFITGWSVYHLAALSEARLNAPTSTTTGGGVRGIFSR